MRHVVYEGVVKKTEEDTLSSSSFFKGWKVDAELAKIVFSAKFVPCATLGRTLKFAGSKKRP